MAGTGPEGPLDEWDIRGKRVIVTGSTNGIGREAAAQLAARGAHVVLACRNVPLAETVAEDIRRQHPGAAVEVGPALDLASMDSVRAFAAAYERSGQRLDVLINNAGTNYQRPWATPEGVGGLCQVNYLGPYALTRLLEATLQRSAPSRVVNLSSVTHRYGWVGPLHSFLASWTPGSYYPSTKLANALFAFELQRRLGPRGVQSCAVDPGGVASSIWKHSVFALPPLSWVINNLYAPPLPDLRFYARGLFASPLVTSWRGVPRKGAAGDAVRGWAWGLVTLAHSLLDWPLRRLSGGRLLAQTRCVPAAPLAYDASLASQLWELSADAAGLPRECRLAARGKR